MKSWLLRATALCLISALAACAGNPGTVLESNAPTDIGGGGSVTIPGAGALYPVSPEPPLGSAALDPDRIHLDDLPLYRGVVKSHDYRDGTHFLTLARVVGTDFAYPIINLETDQDTLSNFDLSELAVGDHLEAYYRDRSNGLSPLIAAVNRLAPDADSVYNGVLISRTQTGAHSGILEIEKQSGHDNVFFEYDESTLFYLEQNELEPGVKLNLLTRGELSGQPPRDYAYEVRPYFDKGSPLS